MVIFFLIMAFSSTLWGINLLTPLHDILYYITKVGKVGGGGGGVLFTSNRPIKLPPLLIV